jgi:hypothetical protein
MLEPMRYSAQVRRFLRRDYLVATLYRPCRKAMICNDRSAFAIVYTAVVAIRDEAAEGIRCVCIIRIPLSYSL